MADRGGTGGKRGATKSAYPIGLAALCCLPTVTIAALLIAAGAVSVGLLIPAIASGAMIGMLAFISIRERPAR
jgi:uncharacterized protein YqfA (UPF0365 family)